MRSIENLLRRHIGLDTTAIGATLIERTVRRRMKQCGLSQPGTYHQRLTTDPHELEQLVEAIVVTETWFFRDHETFHTLARLACHDQPAPPPTAPLRLLSLPCASGEEPYSIAMALLDAGAADTTFQIDAIDISIHALARAQQAEYGKNSFRGNQLDYRARHFIPNQDRYTLSPRVRRPVKFERGNILAADFLAGSPPYDFIFCRNLLIYFDPAAQHLALSKLHQHLAPDGVLFVGPAELPLTTAHGFVHAGLPMAFACRKSEDRRPTAEVRGPKTDSRSQRAEDRPPPSDLRPPTAAPAQLEDARQHTAAGRYAEAAALCAAHLNHHGPSAQAYYLLGQIKAAQNQPGAIADYRKALYLEPNHHETLIQLTRALEQSGDLKAARIYQRRTERVSKLSAPPTPPQP